jgi:ribosomal 30S subunit maturation factor RimM
MPGAPRSFDHRIGRIIRPHGLEGALVLKLFRARRVRTEQLRWRAADAPEPVELELPDGTTHTRGLTAVKFVDGATALLRFDGVLDRNDAEGLVSAFLDIEPAVPPEALADDADRLFGAEVFVDDAPLPLGRVEDIRDNGAQPLLLVGEDQIMIPVVDAFITAVEPGEAGTRVYVRSIPGLLEANRPADADATRREAAESDG